MRFCTTCQAMRETEGGYLKRCRRTSRWICRCCVERTSPSIYRNTSGKPANVERILRDLYWRAR